MFTQLPWALGAASPCCSAIRQALCDRHCPVVPFQSPLFRHNGVSRLRELGLDAGGLRRLLKEPTNGFKIAAAILSQLQAPRLYVW